MTKPTAQQTVQKRLRPLFITAFFQGFVLWYAIEKAFMKSIGFNDETIAVATAIYIMIMLIANFPAGLLADRWSRKAVLYIASGMLLLGSLVCGLSHSFWPYVIGISLWGLFYACYNGTYDSILYDVVLEESAGEGSFETYYGRIQMYDSLAVMLGALFSGVVGSVISLRADYFLTLPFVACSLISLFFFVEPTLHKQVATVTMLAHIKQIRRALSGDTSLHWLVASMVCNIVAMRLIFEFLALWFIGLGLPIISFGPATALFFFGMGSGGYLANKFGNSPYKLVLVAVTTLAISMLLAYKFSITIVVALALLICGLVIVNVLTNRYLHDAVKSNIRAGASSLVTTIGYTVFLPVALCFGVISRNHTVFTASWLVVGAIFAFLFGVVGYLSVLRVRHLA